MPSCIFSFIVYVSLSILTPASADNELVNDLATPIQVTDFLGNTVTLNKPAQRIVALAPHIVENIFSAGGGNAIVGVVDHCDYPEQAKIITNVGSASSISIESIINLKPDLVVVWHSSKGAKLYASLREIGLTTYASAPKSFADIAKSVRDFGVLTGNKTQAEKTASEFEIGYQQLQRIYSTQSKVNTFYQVWDEPILSINNESVISQAIAICGGKNSFADAAALTPKLSIESILLANPEAIVASGVTGARPPWLDRWRKWPSIRAVANDNLFFVPADLIQRYSMRILQGTELLCQQLDLARSRAYSR